MGLNKCLLSKSCCCPAAMTLCAHQSMCPLCRVLRAHRPTLSLWHRTAPPAPRPGGQVTAESSATASSAGAAPLCRAEHFQGMTQTSSQPLDPDGNRRVKSQGKTSEQAFGGIAPSATSNSMVKQYYPLLIAVFSNYKISFSLR